MSTANSPIKPQWPDGAQQDPSKTYALSGRIMLASIIILFVVVVFLVLLHLYARWYLLRLELRNLTRRRNRRNRSTHIVFYVDSNRALANSPNDVGGLDAEVLKSLPLFVYSSETDLITPECAVCLSEFEEGETGRVLPKCKHSFHTECIDMWFCSHSTCPLCRSPVEAVELTETTVSVELQEESRNDDVRGIINGTTSFADRTKRVDVRIDVPNRNELVESIELTSPSQGFRSPGSRLLSLRRIISMSRKSPTVSPSSGVGPSCVPVATESDLESARQESRVKSAGNH